MVDQTTFLAGFGPYLEERLGRPVRFVRRKSYAEISDMLPAGSWMQPGSVASPMS